MLISYVQFRLSVFCCVCPSTWNSDSLPDSLRDPALSFNMFRRQLKTLVLRNIDEITYSPH